MSKARNPLTEAAGLSRRARFAAQYCVDFNGLKAAIRAGYPARSAAKEACGFLKHPEVRAAIAERVRRRFSRVSLTPERVLHEIRRAAYAGLRGLYRDDGTLRDIAEMDDDTLGGLDWIDVAPDGRTVLAVQPMDKVDALELLGRHHRLFGRYAEDPGDERALLALIAEGLERAP